MRLAVAALAVTLGACHLVFDLSPPEADASLDPVFDPSQPLRCPNTYAPIPGASERTRYRLTTTTKGWTNSREDCSRDQEGEPASNTGYTHAVVFDSDAERSAVFVFYQSASPLWVGMSKSDRVDAFVWVTNEDTGGYPQAGTAAWGSLEPSPRGQCVAMRGTGHAEAARLETRSCGDQMLIVCECDEHPEDNDNFD